MIVLWVIVIILLIDQRAYLYGRSSIVTHIDTFIQNAVEMSKNSGEDSFSISKFEKKYLALKELYENKPYTTSGKMMGEFRVRVRVRVRVSRIKSYRMTDTYTLSVSLSLSLSSGTRIHHIHFLSLSLSPSLSLSHQGQEFITYTLSLSVSLSLSLSLIRDKNS
jgi:hypothetical protein